ncbi:hypothetical protein [Dishui Lake phycodnavirus 3]|nr:hypothetical protein [Dishui Lake phycodnavirus 3]
MSIFSLAIVNMSIQTPDGVLDVTNATLRVPQIEVQGTSVTTSLSTLSNVGIGTTSPGGRLHVYGPDAKTFLQSTSNTANVEIGGPTGAIVDLKGPFADDYDLRIQTSGDGGNFATTGNVNHIRLASTNGYTGFGTSTPQYKIDVQGIKGIDAVSNPIAYNPVFLYDDQLSTTTFSGTTGGVGASRDTSNKYITLNDLTVNSTGYVYWPIQMPNSWTAEFDHYSGGGTGGESLSFSFFNTSAPTTIGNHGGYRLAITEYYGGSPASKIVLYYQGSEVAQKDIVGGIPFATWNKVIVQYDRGSISTSLNGRSVFSYKATENADSYNGRYSGFLGRTVLVTNYHRVRNIKFTSGMTWIYPVGSNASTIAYLSGNVGIGTNNPLEQLHVTANVKATHFIGDGGLLSNIATTLDAIVNQGNVTSNTVRFTNSNTSILATGNIVVQPGAFFVGDGSKLVNIPTNFESIIINGNSTGNTVYFNAKPTAIQATGNIVATAGAHFVGDGGLLSNIATTLESIVNQGNTTSNTVQFTNTNRSLVTSGKVGISNAAPVNTLDVGSNVSVLDTGSNVLTVRGNVSANTLTLGDIQVVASYGLNHVTAENNQTGDTLVLTNATTAIDAASNIELGGTLKFDSNVVITGGGTGTYVNNLRIAPTASNLVTYDKTTGEVFDSGGLISNKLSIVSEQPPSALTGATTTVTGHGKYVVASSTGTAYNAFDKSTGVWTSGATYNGTTGAYTGSVDLGGAQTVSGEWLSVEFPYKTVLRHVTLLPGSTVASFPGTASIYGTNDNGTTWTLLRNWSSETAATTSTLKTFTVNASAEYKKYALVVNATSAGSTTTQVGEWRLFTETFTVDAGKVNMTGASGLETGFTEHPVVPITFDEEIYDSSNPIEDEGRVWNYYVDGHGTYEITASTYYQVDGQVTRPPWRLFNYKPTDYSYWQHGSGTAYNSSSPYEYTGTTQFTTDVGGTRYLGHWVQIKVPYAITLAHTDIYRTPASEFPDAIYRSPGAGAILGSNDGERWYKLTQFSGASYASGDKERIDVNATTPYQYYRLVATNIVGGNSQTIVHFNEWRLFAEKDVTKFENVHISGDLSSETLQTGYIKWPKVPLKANESEGYVASQSSYFYGNYKAWKAFNENATREDDAWITAYNYVGGTGVADPAKCASMNGIYGEWLGIELPQAIKVSYFNLYNRNGGTNYRAPKTGRFYGSHDGVSFEQLVAWQNITINDGQLPTRIDVSSDVPYKFYRIQIEAMVGVGDHAAIGELQLFEAATGVGGAPTSAKLQVHGSLGLAKGSSLYAGDSVVAEFPRHDRPLTKYPEILMGGVNNQSLGGYVVSSSSSLYAADGFYNSNVYNGIIGNEGWHTENFNQTPYIAGIVGNWHKTQMPKPIKVVYFDVAARTGYESTQAPRDFTILGSNDDATWDILKTVTNARYRSGQYNRYDINSTKYYKYLVFVFQVNTSGNVGGTVGEMRWWGYEEGDESVDVIHKSVPNKPGTQQLAVYWDANDPASYSFADSTKVYDLSGNGRTGTLTGGVGYDAEYNAFTFDGVNDVITVSDVGTSGAQVLSMSGWVRTNSIGEVASFGIGTYTAARCMYFNVTNSVNSYSIVCNTHNNTYTGSFPANTWLHVTMVYLGGNISITTLLLYINGQLQIPSSVPAGTTPLNLPSPCELRLGRSIFGTYYAGSIANFRLFTKALNADQIRELYEYDAPRFGHRTNVVALRKGNLGVGVTAPTSRFEVAGADGLQEYPPRGMTGYETYIEGHGVFRANNEKFYSANGSYPWRAFDRDTSTHYHSDTTYNVSTGVYEGTATLAGYMGEWISLEMPYKTKISSISLRPRAGWPTRTINEGVLLGRNGGNEWELIKQFSGLTWATDTEEKYLDVNAIKYYSEYALLVTKPGAAANSIQWSIFRLFGTPAPSSLEDGHLTLGKALTVPRFSGHAAGAQTPRAESLVVHYDTTVDSVVSGSTVVDISGNGRNGTLNGNATYSSVDRALTFDGSGDYVVGTLNNASGAWAHSISLWFYWRGNSADPRSLVHIGNANNSQSIMSTLLIYSDGKIRFGFYDNDCDTGSGAVRANTWNQLLCTYTGGTGVSSRKVYINGESKAITLVGANSTNALNLPANSTFYLAAQTGGSFTYNGSISNFKIWGGVALTAEEVAAEYALGRTGKALNVTDTAVCIGGRVPRAQLDVRGSALVGGNVGVGTIIPVSRMNVYQGPVINGGAVNPTGGLTLTGHNGATEIKWALYINNNQDLILGYGTDHDGNLTGTVGYFTDSATDKHFNNFTGQHRTFIKDVPFSKANELEGLIVSSDQNKYIKMSGGIAVGSNAITTNESLPVVSLSNVVADKRCFGVISASEDPEQRSDAYGTFISPFEKEKGDTRVYINSVGEGAIWVVNTNGPLESGDYITTSNVPGYGQKQDDDILHNYSVAKITMDCDFAPIDQPVQRILRSNVIEWVTTTEDEYSNLAIDDRTTEEQTYYTSNIETIVSEYDEYDFIRYTKIITMNVSSLDEYDKVHIDPYISFEEYSNLTIEEQSAYDVTYTKTVKVSATATAYDGFADEEKSFYTPVYVKVQVDAEVYEMYPNAIERTRTIYKKKVITEKTYNVLDEHGQLQWEDDPSGATEKAYKIRYLTADGTQTDEANAVHIAAFVGCTYHCG